MDDLLFLAHRIPYPPDKGDKIRAWHVLRHLASRYRIHLATFIDTPDDTRHIERLREVCTSVFWRPLFPKMARLYSLRGVLTGASLTEGYFGDPRFRAGVDQIIAQYQPKIHYVFSSSMAPYGISRIGARVILDLVDVDSQKWGQYAQAGSWFTRFLYRREQRTLLELERRSARNADVVTLVTPAEAELFATLAPESADKIQSIGNGVDIDYFDPSQEFFNPLGKSPGIVFTGAMDYRPNIEAMLWFAREVMPLLRRFPQPPCLWIVGANPTRAVRALAGPDIRVTGRVADVRPYLRHARVVVVPLHIARGIQNKVIEAMAMGSAIIVTPQIQESLSHSVDDVLLTAETPPEFVDAIAAVMGGARANLGKRARQYADRHFRWGHALARLDRALNIDDAIAVGADRTSCVAM